jgi:hypothetical protein
LVGDTARQALAGAAVPRCPSLGVIALRLRFVVDAPRFVTDTSFGGLLPALLILSGGRFFDMRFRSMPVSVRA